MLVFLTSCLGEVPGEKENNTAPEDEAETARDTEVIPSAHSPLRFHPREKPGEVPLHLQEKKPNELGEIMILMYHDIGHPEDEWRRTPENFRRDLRVLYENDFRIVSLNDVITGNIDIPAGTSPVVLTFDDGFEGQFKYRGQDGELQKDQESAVYIMENFYRENPDFGLGGTFYIYYPVPFRQPEYVGKKLNYLVEQGFEVGNHSYGHANLSRISTEEVQRELALHVKETWQYLNDYNVNSLALPYGAYPEETSSAVKGSYNGIEYHHEAVLLVGSNPAPSPFHKEFDPHRLPRIRASEMETDGVGMYDWLEYFEENPHKLYISDGDTDYITVPKSQKENINNEAVKEKDKTVRYYSD